MNETDLEQIYKKNIQFLQQHWTSFSSAVRSADTSKLGLQISPTGINITIDSQTLYPNDIDNSIENQVNNFISNPSSISANPFRYKKELKQELHSKIIREIEKISPYGGDTFNSYGQNPNLKIFPFMVMAGIGSGKHIEKLLEKTDIKHLIIIDESYSFLKLSMHIIDWTKIISHFNQDGYSINFYISNQPIKVAYSLLNNIFIDNPYKVYYVPYYTHYKTNFFDEVKKHFLDKFQLLFQGLGFIDDELNSLRKTLKNLDHNIPVYMGTNDIPKNSTLFIVASGPSLDNDIEYIKKHKDDVVIFSCGTALRILEKNGITPDFHFEIEREEEIHDVLQQYTSKHIRDKVALVGLNVLYDKVFTEDFKESYLYFRETDSGSSIISNNIPKLFHTNPTVTNGAISFATEFNWDKIYLFGADMGFKDKDKHHSKDAFMYSPKNKTFDWHSEPGNDITNHLEANFGGEKIYCTNVFFLTKQNIENLLFKQQKKLYNCSNGVKIEYTIPFHSKDIVIEKSKKKKTIKAIKKSFKNLKTNEAEFKENYTKQVELFYTMIDKIKNEIHNKDIKSFADIFLILDNSFDIFRQMEVAIDKEYKSRKLLGTLILRGTIATLYAVIYTHCLATYDLKKATKFAIEAFDLIVLYLEDLKREVINV